MKLEGLGTRLGVLYNTLTTTKGYLKATKGCGTPRKRPSENIGHRYRRAMKTGQTTLEPAKSIDEPNFIVSYQS